MRSINHSSIYSPTCHLQYLINNNQIDLHYPSQPKRIPIPKQDGRKRNKWRGNHNQDMQENKKNIPLLQKDASLLLFCLLNLQDFNFSSQEAFFFLQDQMWHP